MNHRGMYIIGALPPQTERISTTPPESQPFKEHKLGSAGFYLESQGGQQGTVQVAAHRVEVSSWLLLRLCTVLRLHGKAHVGFLLASCLQPSIPDTIGGRVVATRLRNSRRSCRQVLTIACEVVKRDSRLPKK